MQWLRHILHNIDFKVYGAPNPIYKDSQPTIYIIEDNHIKIKVNNIAIPINFVQAQYYLLTIDSVKTKTAIQSSDIGTNRSTGYIPKFNYFYIHSAQY